MWPIVALAGLLALAASVPWALNRWRFRHIPGPFSLPLIGDLPWVVALGLHEYCWRCQQKYGKIFKVYVGSQMMVMVADPETCKRLTLRNNVRTLGRQLMLDSKEDAMNTTGLAAASGELWRTLRLAWQPAFSSYSLEGYNDRMDECALQLAQHLRKKGDSGEVVEMWRALGKMTLGVVGSTAYGVDFHTLPEHGMTASQEAEGAALQAACATLFAALGLRYGSLWTVVLAMVPWAPRLLSWLARTFPDRRLKEVMQARKVVRELSASLIAKWRAAHPAAAAAPASPTANGSAAAKPSSPNGTAAAAQEQQKEQPLVETISAIVAPDAANNAAASAAGSGNGDDDEPAAAQNAAGAGGANKARPSFRRASGMGVHPGSFMGLMLDAKHKGSGHGLEDGVIVAQSNTFILAGYETTANTLCFCIYNIARHPKVQARLLQEVDAYGRDRSVAYKDLSQFPYTEAVVRESLRLFPPATLLNRHCAKGFALTPELAVPPDTSVFAFLYGYQRSPEYWPDAEGFRPERWLPEGAHLVATTPDAWTPFGSGARMCIGWRFALQEAKIALIRLYQHQTYELLPGQVPLVVEQNLTLSPKHGLKVRVVQRGA